MSPERLAEIRRIARGQGGFATTENERSRLRELLAEVERLKVEIIDWKLAKADSDREVDRLTAECDRSYEVVLEVVLRAEAERDRLAARVTQLEDALRQAEEYCARPRGTCFPAEILADSDPAPACPVAYIRDVLGSSRNAQI
jgi:hypothetical protein